MSHVLTTRCRLCGNPRLTPVLDLGAHAITAVFPAAGEPDPASAPLELVRCDGPADTACGLLQLRHSTAVAEMYGTTYGYRSSTSPTSVAHLEALVAELAALVRPRPGDAVLDIGCNDGTTLNAWAAHADGLVRIGVDPSSAKFLEHFQPGIRVACDFFSAARVRELVGAQPVRVVTSIAMFYDLDDPLAFVRDVEAVLAPDGVWAFELSYLPLMFTNLTYDQTLHEHVAYYALRQIVRLLERTGLELLSVRFNEMNGGSFRCVAGRRGGPYAPDRAGIDAALAAEAPLATAAPYARFAARVAAHRDELRGFLELVHAAGRSVLGYGASTKGNLTLGWCGIGPELLPAVSDRQAAKHGRVTPGHRIPIIAHAEARARRPDYWLVLIWHLRREVILDERDYLEAGGRLVFPLPRLHVVDRDNWRRYVDAPLAELCYAP